MPPGGYAGGYGGRQTGGYGYGGPQGFIGAGYGGGRGMGGYNGPQGAGMGAQQGGPVNTAPTQGPQGWLMYIDQESGDPYYHHPETNVTQWEPPAEWNQAPPVLPPPGDQRDAVGAPRGVEPGSPRALDHAPFTRSRLSSSSQPAGIIVVRRPARLRASLRDAPTRFYRRQAIWVARCPLLVREVSRRPPWM